MNTLQSKLALSAVVLLTALAGCKQQPATFSSDNVIALADKQRQTIIIQTRAASYAIFPDVKDPDILKDKTFLEAIIAERARGSAVGVRADGVVTTNVHVVRDNCVVEDSPDPRVGQHSEFFRHDKEANGESHCLLLKANSTKVYRAKIIKLDEENDIAMLQIESDERSFPFLEIAEVGSFGEGAEVFTIGSPLGNTNVMTPGHIGNVDYVMPTQEGGKKIPRKLQFSAPVLPGNSGGPLVAFATGKIVGQVVAIIVMHGIPTQMSYANPVDVIKSNLDSIPAKTR